MMIFDLVSVDITCLITIIDICFKLSLSLKSPPLIVFNSNMVLRATREEKSQICWSKLPASLVFPEK